MLSELREFLDRRRGDAILLAEANVQADRIPKYFDDGQRFQMLFNFILNQRLFLALARRQAAPLAEGLKRLPEMPWICQWANFVRNHDELTLDQLSDGSATIFSPRSRRMKTCGSTAAGSAAGCRRCSVGTRGASR